MDTDRHGCEVEAFPPVEEADEAGVLAVGGDLSVERLLLAYSSGIFPWPHWGTLLWFAPDPRCVLRPEEVRVTNSMARLIKSNRFRITSDEAFNQVIERCSTIPRRGQPGTWITPEIQDVYCKLHEEGFAHSFEAWHEERLVGGLYGISLGGAFFGESMFSEESNASKACFITMCRQLEQWEFDFIDCQVPHQHLARLGAYAVSRNDYMLALAMTRERKTRRGVWALEELKGDEE